MLREGVALMLVRDEGHLGQGGGEGWDVCQNSMVSRVEEERLVRPVGRVL